MDEGKLKGLRRLNLEDVDDVAGGTWDEMERYLNELCVKYGLEPGDFATLNDLMTPEEVDYSTDLLLKK